MIFKIVFTLRDDTNAKISKYLQTDLDDNIDRIDICDMVISKLKQENFDIDIATYKEYLNRKTNMISFTALIITIINKDIHSAEIKNTFEKILSVLKVLDGIVFYPEGKRDPMNIGNIIKYITGKELFYSNEEQKFTTYVSNKGR